MSYPEHERYSTEVAERWGGTTQHAQSQARTRSYGDEDWAKIHAESESIEAAFAEAMAEGASPDGARASAIAERARVHIDRWHYACSHDMHAALADMYSADGRFRAHFDERSAGLADFVSAAIKANGARRATT